MTVRQIVGLGRKMPAIMHYKYRGVAARLCFLLTLVFLNESFLFAESKDSISEAQFGKLSQDLESLDMRTQFSAISILSSCRDDHGLNLLVQKLRSGSCIDAMGDTNKTAYFDLPITSLETACVIIKSLSQWPSDKVLPVLEGIIQMPNVFSKKAAVEVLGTIIARDGLSDKTISLLLETASDQHGSVRAAFALWCPKVVDKCNTNEITISTALHTQIAETLKKLTKDAVPEVRLRAAEKLPIQKEMQTLCLMLRDSKLASVDPRSFCGSWQVRTGVVKILGEARDKRALESILRALKDAGGALSLLDVADKKGIDLASNMAFRVEASVALAMLGDIEGLEAVVKIARVKPGCIYWVSEDRKDALRSVWRRKDLEALAKRRPQYAKLVQHAMVWLCKE